MVSIDLHTSNIRVYRHLENEIFPLLLKKVKFFDDGGFYQTYSIGRIFPFNIGSDTKKFKSSEYLEKNFKNPANRILIRKTIANSHNFIILWRGKCMLCQNLCHLIFHKIIRVSVIERTQLKTERSNRTFKAEQLKFQIFTVLLSLI